MYQLHRMNLYFQKKYEYNKVEARLNIGFGLCMTFKTVHYVPCARVLEFKLNNYVLRFQLLFGKCNTDNVR